jgi:hypothetical protein
MIRQPHARTLAFALAAMLPSLAAHADITLEERLTVDGAGMMKMANMTGRTVTTIANDRARFETDIQMQSKLVRMFAQDAGPTAEIIRLDQEKVYSLDLKKKEYTEATFAEQRAAMEKALEQARQAQTQASQGGPIDESQCEWSEPKVDVKKTGEKATFAGYETERVTINATQTCTNKQRGTACDIGLLLDQWYSPKFAGGNDTIKFYQAYAEKMGYAAAMSKDAAQRAESLFGRYKGVWAEVGKQMRDMQGYPVKSTFGLGIGGAQCQGSQANADASGAPGAQPPTGAEAQTAVATAAGETAGQVAAEEAGKSAFGGIAGQLGGKLAGSLFGKKKKDQTAPAPADPASASAAPAPAAFPGGLVPMMTFTTELVSVNRTGVAGETFEVPAGFKKVTPKN